jgi:hypothetical protein
MSTSMGMEAISFSEQATAALRDYFTGSNSGVVGQDIRDVGDVVEKFTPPPRVPVTSRRGTLSSVWGPRLHRPDFRGGLSYLDAVEPEPTRLPQRLVLQRPRPSPRVGSESCGGGQSIASFGLNRVAAHSLTLAAVAAPNSRR